jgi:putative endonuclease
MTNNLQRRLSEHKTGLNPKAFSKRYRLYKLIWFQEFSTPMEAIQAEKKIKGWTRAKKVELIKQLNPGFKDISR